MPCDPLSCPFPRAPQELDAVTATQSHEEPSALAGSRPAARRDHSTGTPGGEHIARAQDESPIQSSEGISRGTAAQRRSRSREPVLTHPCEDRPRSRSRTSRRSSPAAPRVEFLETPGGRYPRGPDLPQGTTQLSHPIASMRAPNKLITNTPRDWSSVGVCAITMPVGLKEQELSPLVPMDLRTSLHGAYARSSLPPID